MFVFGWQGVRQSILNFDNFADEIVMETFVTTSMRTIDSSIYHNTHPRILNEVLHSCRNVE